MGAKFSKDERKYKFEEETSDLYSGCNDEEQQNQPGQAQEFGNFDRKKSLSKRFRHSCRKWATQKGMMKKIKIDVVNRTSEQEINKPDKDKEPDND